VWAGRLSPASPKKQGRPASGREMHNEQCTMRNDRATSGLKGRDETGQFERAHRNNPLTRSSHWEIAPTKTAPGLLAAGRSLTHQSSFINHQCLSRLRPPSPARPDWPLSHSSSGGPPEARRRRVLIAFAGHHKPMSPPGGAGGLRRGHGPCGRSGPRHGKIFPTPFYHIARIGHDV